MKKHSTSSLDTFKPSEACLRCGLYKGVRKPKLGARGSDTPDLLIVGEAPGFEEDTLGKPFVGKSGQLLDQMLTDAGFDLKRVRWTNVCRCRPPENATPSTVQINCCKQNLYNEIVETKPKLIVPMGNTPCRAVLDKAGITALRGLLKSRTFEEGGDVFQVFPTFHPAYALRDPTKQPYIEQDLKRAYEILYCDAPQKSPTDYRHFTRRESAETVLAALRRLPGGTLVSLDIETNAEPVMAPEFKILCIGVCYTPAKACTVHFKTEKFGRWFLDELFALENIEYVFHNGVYDVTGIQRWLSYPFPLVQWGHDTILQAAALDENTAHGLKALTAINIPEMAGYEAEVAEESEEKGWEGVDKRILTQYNCTDVDMTLRLHGIQIQQLKEQGLLFVYRRVMMEGIKVLHRIRWNGFAMDREQVRLTKTAYERRLEEQLSHIQGYPAVKQTIKLWATKKMNDYNGKHARARELEAFVEPFNPASVQQKRILLFDVMKMEVIKKSKQTGEPSCDKEVLEEYAKKDKLCAKLTEASKLSHLYNTYVKPVEDVWLHTIDGRSHSTYQLHTTVTGRTSSKQPNHENIPRPDTNPDIRNFFVAEKGKVLIEADYSQLELRIAAMYGDDPVLIDAYKHKKDVHRILASKFYKIPEDQVSKDQRTRAKRTNFGVLYGMEADRLAGEIAVSKREAQGLIDTFWNAYRGVKRWKSKVIMDAMRQNYVESFIGRRRRLPAIHSQDRGMRAEAERQAVNSPIQGLGSDLLMMGMAALQKHIDKTPEFKDVKLVATVHDSLVAEVPVKVKDRFVKAMRHFLTAYKADWMRGVPIEVDIKIGKRWGTMKEV